MAPPSRETGAQIAAEGVGAHPESFGGRSSLTCSRFASDRRSEGTDWAAGSVGGLPVVQGRERKQTATSSAGRSDPGEARRLLVKRRRASLAGERAGVAWAGGNRSIGAVIMWGNNTSGVGVVPMRHRRFCGTGLPPGGVLVHRPEGRGHGCVAFADVAFHWRFSPLSYDAAIVSKEILTCPIRPILPPRITPAIQAIHNRCSSRIIRHRPAFLKRWHEG